MPAYPAYALSCAYRRGVYAGSHPSENHVLEGIQFQNLFFTQNCAHEHGTAHIKQQQESHYLHSFAQEPDEEFSEAPAGEQQACLNHRKRHGYHGYTLPTGITKFNAGTKAYRKTVGTQARGQKYRFPDAHALKG